MRSGPGRFGAFGTVLVTVGLLVGVAGSPAGAATGRPFVNHSSGKCLEIADWRTDNGAPARQWDCTGGANQKWVFANSDGALAIVNVNSGKCLEIADWRKDNGAPARQWDCTGGANQKWQYMEVGPGIPADSHTAEYLLNLNSALLLEIADWRTDNGAPARQWIYGGSRQANMEWSYCSNWPGCMTD
ncbi:hypothetical protein GCM10018781_13380 [Kitasatospora indigofera]|uniref:Ricin B lectin domain-containing protein n=1 Tax=Kitasatospora indigofera TaxID=67307 RepID=A0A919FEK1_9ACTN|nr:RICIN domain-containing protein [Kitasatospora indigofera]GHH63588.1 hypothetical protein GCM10018781_13380 [Kitasatospora indigofera]